MSDSPGKITPRPFELLLDQPLRAYWRGRVERHFQDRYAGIPFLKFPEDLRVYEDLLWQSRPSIVIEVGVHLGASVLWFRDRLEALTHYGGARDFLVIGIDLDVEQAILNLQHADPAWGRHIKLIAGDITTSATIAAVRSLVPTSSQLLLVDDSGHDYPTTLATLRGLADLVPPAGFIVVEDTCVDIAELRCATDWPQGALRALQEWLASPAGADFEQRRDLEQYVVTSHPGGFLRRRGTGKPV